MNGNNTSLAINLLTGLLSQAGAVSALVGQANAEGRDVTSAELDGVFSADAVARAKLQADIDAAK